MQIYGQLKTEEKSQDRLRDSYIVKTPKREILDT